MLTGKKLGAAIAEAIKLKGISKKAVADHFGIRPPSIQDWVNRGTIDKEKLPELWNFFSDVVGPHHWGLPQRVEEHPLKYGIGPPQEALGMSPSPFEDPPLIKWEDLLNIKTLPDVFSVLMPDDSMEPSIKQGTLLVFDKKAKPKPGHGILVADAHGGLHVRRNREVRTGVWEAQAANTSHRTLTPETDGVTIVAAMSWQQAGPV